VSDVSGCAGNAPELDEWRRRMGKNRPTGVCHICGQDGPLSFEHIPPRQAFNDRRVVSVTFEEAIHLGPDEVPRGEIRQRGMGGYTLCERCNNNTGALYGGQFVDWCYMGMSVLAGARGQPVLTYVLHLYPLPVIKEIVTMFFSVNHDRFRTANPELVRFVMNPDSRGLPAKYRFYTYFNTSPRFRSISTSAMMRLGRSEPILISEFAFPPYGYVMTIDSDSPDPRLWEITHFTQYERYELAEIGLNLPLLPVHTPFPGDYRTKQEIIEQEKISRAMASGETRDLRSF
jgi:hypothetical protein